MHILKLPAFGAEGSMVLAGSPAQALNLLVNPGFRPRLMGRSLRRAGRILRHRRWVLELRIIGWLAPRIMESAHIRELTFGSSGMPFIPLRQQTMWRAYTKPSAALREMSIRPAGGSAPAASTLADWARVALPGFKSNSLMRTIMSSPFTSRPISQPAWG